MNQAEVYQITLWGGRTTTIQGEFRPMKDPLPLTQFSPTHATVQKFLDEMKAWFEPATKVYETHKNEVAKKPWKKFKTPESVEELFLSLRAASLRLEMDQMLDVGDTKDEKTAITNSPYFQSLSASLAMYAAKIDGEERKELDKWNAKNSWRYSNLIKKYLDFYQTDVFNEELAAIKTQFFPKHLEKRLAWYISAKNKEEIESIFTHNLFYLAQAYGNNGNAKMSSYYCHMVSMIQIVISNYNLHNVLLDSAASIKYRSKE